ncbi:rho operon leader peptide [Escherichia marmotae]|nr:rho operon leader peptide [Escherichia marmotae]AUT28561.1 rho operon leader peptide [Escherichia marmotae]
MRSEQISNPSCRFSSAYSPVTRQRKDMSR